MALNRNSTKYIPTTAKIGPEVTMAIGLEIGDVEQMCAYQIVNQLPNPNRSFVSVCTVIPHDLKPAGAYKLFSDDDLTTTRISESKKAAMLGSYQASYLLNYKLGDTFQEGDAIINDYIELLKAYKPKILYTFSPLDTDKNHVAVLKMVLAAIAKLDDESKPIHLYATQTEGSLDILLDRTNVVALEDAKNYAMADSLLAVYDSALEDETENLSISYEAIDLMPLLKQGNFSLRTFTQNSINDYLHTVLKNLD